MEQAMMKFIIAFFAQVNTYNNNYLDKRRNILLKYMYIKWISEKHNPYSEKSHYASSSYINISRSCLFL